MSVSIFICGRGKDRVRCVVTGCGNWAVRRCAFPLKGKASGRLCDRPICEKCAAGEKVVGYCPTHRGNHG